MPAPAHKSLLQVLIDLWQATTVLKDIPGPYVDAWGKSYGETEFCRISNPPSEDYNRFFNTTSYLDKDTFTFTVFVLSREKAETVKAALQNLMDFPDLSALYPGTVVYHKRIGSLTITHHVDASEKGIDAGQTTDTWRVTGTWKFTSFATLGAA